MKFLSFKTQINLALLALVAFFLCQNQPAFAYCTGSPNLCEEYTSSNSCNPTGTGCTWEVNSGPRCTGEGVICSGVNNQLSCNNFSSLSACMWVPMSGSICVGTGIGCSDVDNPSDCRAITGCSWDSPYPAYCLGTGLNNNCDNASNSSIQCGYFGCTWNAAIAPYCQGTPIACSAAGLPTECTDLGCTYVPQVIAGCSGAGLGLCSNAANDQTKCQNSGCAYTPPVVAGCSGGGITAQGDCISCNNQPTDGCSGAALSNGCNYTPPTPESCTGTPISCGAIGSDQNLCGQTAGCAWNAPIAAACSGTGLGACSNANNDSTKCNLFGCSFTSAVAPSCTGSGETCGMQNSSTCSSISGCYMTADTPGYCSGGQFGCSGFQPFSAECNNTAGCTTKTCPYGPWYNYIQVCYHDYNTQVKSSGQSWCDGQFTANCGNYPTASYCAYGYYAGSCRWVDAVSGVCTGSGTKPCSSGSSSSSACGAIRNCNWNAGTASSCSGTAKTCSAQTSSSTCTPLTGCNWTSSSAGYCSGTRSNNSCTGGTSSTCGVGALTGCTYTPAKNSVSTGTAKLCSVNTTQNSCINQWNCQWTNSAASTCTGSVKACTSNTTSSACTSQYNCTWTNAVNAYCTGTARACNSYNSNTALCNSKRNCSWNVGRPNSCSGTPKSCNTVTSSATCSAMTNCGPWDPGLTVATCRGSGRTSCDYAKNDYACGQMRNCAWSINPGGKCTGIGSSKGVVCREINDEAYCQNPLYKCSWNPSTGSCKGSPISCNAFNDENSCKITGCTWVNTATGVRSRSVTTNPTSTNSTSTSSTSSNQFSGLSPPPAVAFDDANDDYTKNPIIRTMCSGLNFVHGNAGKVIVSIAIIFIGAGFFMGGVPWIVMITVALSIGAIFGAQTIVTATYGPTKVICSTIE